MQSPTFASHLRASGTKLCGLRKLPVLELATSHTRVLAIISYGVSNTDFAGIRGWGNIGPLLYAVQEGQKYVKCLGTGRSEK